MKHTGRKGWQASVKDTWSLNSTLNPIIAAGLRKFIAQGDKLGVPGAVNECRTFQENADAWKEILHKMLYAFEDKAPNMNDYDFEYDIDFESGDFGSLTLTCTNEAERDRYQYDEAEHDKLTQEGRDLFAKYYRNLWW